MKVVAVSIAFSAQPLGLQQLLPFSVPQDEQEISP